MSSLSLVDWIFIAVLAFSAVGGMVRGFFRSVFGLGGLLAGLLLAAWNYAHLAHMLTFVHDESAADIVAFVLIAVAVMVAAHIVGYLLAKAMQKIGLGCLDRLGGAVFGLVQGALLLVLCVWVTVAFLPQTQWLTESRLPRYFFGACHLSTHVSPEGLSKRVGTALQTLEERTPEWMHQNQQPR
ncbi:MAG TPA: CvpA family protein [Terracidiphilus sp.]|nr:CvpA family protein [Terracidiphilus sp.]